jgi:hypothetical protein
VAGATLRSVRGGATRLLTTARRLCRRPTATWPRRRR